MVQSNTNGSVLDRKDMLPFDSLEIRNFRAFGHLTIGKLGRVNLITGRNNVGKTALLEATFLLSRSGGFEALWQIFLNRNQLEERDSRLTNDELDYNEGNLIQALLSLFQERTSYPQFVIDSEQILGESYFSTYQNRVSLKLQFRQHALRGTPSRGNGHTDDSRYLFAISTLFHNRLIGFDGVSSLYSAVRILQTGLHDFLSQSTGVFPSVFIPSTGLTRHWSEDLWSRNIAATQFEDVVVEKLRIIEPRISRANFRKISDKGSYGIPFLLLEGQKQPFPINLMGDGISRLFGLVVAMVSVQGGILLIDEFENGLHYSIQKQIWKFIFELARQLNVQVFATTHSWDCIEAFQQAAAEDDDLSGGSLIRLQRESDNIVSTVFDENDLEVVTRRGIEVR